MNTEKKDEFCELLRQIRPPARYEGYTPRFSAQRRAFTFNQATATGEKPVDETLWIIKDDERYVAYVRPAVEITEGIRMITFRPGDGPTRLDMPTGRLHHDTELGPTIQTCKGWFDGKKRYSIPSDIPYEVKTTDNSVQIVRRYDGNQTTVAIQVDPHFGYYAEVRYEIREGIEETKFTKMMGFGTYDPYPSRQRYSRTIFTPADSSEYLGYYSNSASIQSISNNSGSVAIRDGGFVAFVSEPDEWGYAFSRKGGGTSTRVKICDAHNVWHQRLKVPDDRVFVERLSAVPPEMSRHLCEQMKLYDSTEKPMLRIGVREDFSSRPTARTAPTRGIIIPSSNARIVSSAPGNRSRLKITKSLESAIPQLCLEPCTRYCVEAVMSIDAGSVRLVGKFFEWSPKFAAENDEWLGEFSSESVTPEMGTKRIGFQFTTPSWDPFIHLVVEVEDGPAYMDEFYFRSISPQSE